MLYEVITLHKTYQSNGQEVHALRGIDLDIESGEFSAIAGPSGSGKTTLLNVMGGIDRPDEGDVIISGQTMKGLSESELSKIRLNRSYNFV